MCFKHDSDGEVEILLITSLSNGTWGIPKGHVEADESASFTAVREAIEEAGVIGTAMDGYEEAFAYRKAGDETNYKVSVFMVRVINTTPTFPEAGLRTIRWAKMKDAAALVGARELKELLMRMPVPQLGSTVRELRDVEDNLNDVHVG